jgi:membrane dipeptidase
LSDFGKKVIRECNRLGIMVDVSHASDQTFWEALEVSSKPLIATHSGARSLSDMTRNLTDPMLKALAAKGGIVGVCGLFDRKESEKYGKGRSEENYVAESVYLAAKFSDPFALAAALRDPRDQAEARKQLGLDPADEPYLPIPQSNATIARITLDHMDYMIRLIGVDHVAIGTDLDMRSPGYAELCREIVAGALQRGYTREQLHKILGGTFLRYFREVTREAAR